MRKSEQGLASKLRDELLGLSDLNYSYISLQVLDPVICWHSVHFQPLQELGTLLTTTLSSNVSKYEPYGHGSNWKSKKFNWPAPWPAGTYFDAGWWECGHQMCAPFLEPVLFISHHSWKGLTMSIRDCGSGIWGYQTGRSHQSQIPFHMKHTCTIERWCSFAKQLCCFFN